MLALAAGLAVAFWPMWASGFAELPADPADSRLVNFILEHGHRWLTGAAASPFDPPSFFPQRGVGAYTEVLLGAVPLYTPWRLLGLAPDSAYQAWLLSVAALDYAAAWLLFRRGLRFGPGPAAAGALVAAFGSPRLQQLNHPHLWASYFTFLALYAVVRLWTAPARRPAWLALLAASVLGQLSASVQLGWLLVFSLALALLWALALPGSRPTVLALARAHPVALLACAALSLACLWPLAGPYLEAGRAVGVRTFEEARGMLPRSQSWLYQGPGAWVWGWTASWRTFTWLPMEGEQRVGAGLVTTALALALAWRSRRRPGWAVLALTALTLVALATIHGRFSPWEGVMAVVPGATSLRAVGRVSLLLLVPAGCAVAALAEHGPRRWALPVVALCLLEQGQRPLGSFDKQAQREAVAAVARAVPAGCPAFFWAPRSAPPVDEVTQLDAMWAALQLGVPTVNGYSGAVPPGWALGAHSLTRPGAEARLKDALGRWEAAQGLPPGQVCFVAAPEP